jgi:hypothetical protein
LVGVRVRLEILTEPLDGFGWRRHAPIAYVRDSCSNFAVRDFVGPFKHQNEQDVRFAIVNAGHGGAEERHGPRASMGLAAEGTVVFVGAGSRIGSERLRGQNRKWRRPVNVKEVLTLFFVELVLNISAGPGALRRGASL